ncbi:MAG: response regulator [Gemmatimonadota bacterium]|nr:MAG: response regulator [Gemmatimonadota bacterium]
MARILIAEDEALVRNTLRRILELDGHEVVEAENGEVALALFREQHCDLVIADLFMPVMDGLELLNELSQKFPGTKLIAISGSVYERRPRFLEIAGRIQSVRTLAKPFTASDVTTMVNQTLAEESPEQPE